MPPLVTLHLTAVTASLRRLISVARMGDILPVTASVADTIAMLIPDGPAEPPRSLPRPDNRDDRDDRHDRKVI